LKKAKEKPLLRNAVEGPGLHGGKDHSGEPGRNKGREKPRGRRDNVPPRRATEKQKARFSKNIRKKLKGEKGHAIIERPIVSRRRKD